MVVERKCFDFDQARIPTSVMEMDFHVIVGQKARKTVAPLDETNSIAIENFCKAKTPGLGFRLQTVEVDMRKAWAVLVDQPERRTGNLVGIDTERLGESLGDGRLAGSQVALEKYDTA